MDENFEKQIQFKVFGLPIENFSILFGLFLFLWGIGISYFGDSKSLTSYIPSFIGLPIIIFSYLSIKFKNKKKLFMHIVVTFGLICFLGGLDFVRSAISGNIFLNFWADTSKIMMLITGFYFTYQCIKSFIHARKNKN
jgi:hypothetical protein